MFRKITRNKLNAGEPVFVGRVVCYNEKDGNDFDRSFVKDAYLKRARGPDDPRVSVHFDGPIAYEWSTFARMALNCLKSGQSVNIDMGGRNHGRDGSILVAATEIVYLAMEIQKLLGERGRPPEDRKRAKAYGMAYSNNLPFNAEPGDTIYHGFGFKAKVGL